MEYKNPFDYITTEENNYKTVRVPITDSVDWNMPEHIERCFNVANGWYHKGKNDGTRPYQDIVTPIVNVAQRSEGFDVKDIVPFVNQPDADHLSFLIKKYHPKWARKYELDTFIDELVTSSITYDLALVKNINRQRPELIPLQKIAFCDQTDIMSGPICLKHQYTVEQLTEFKGKWYDDKIEEAITMSLAQKVQPNQNKTKVKTPGKYIEVYELRGQLPESWLKDDGEMLKFVPQLHIVCFYTAQDGSKNGITLYKGKDKKLSDTYKALVLNPVFGRACGKSIVETLFDPQVWTNYSAIKIKNLLDSAITMFQTADEEIAGQKLTELPNNTILKHSDGKPLSKVDGTLQNLPAFTNYQVGLENSARVLGSASDAQLGTNPTSGTPFALQQLVVQQGQGIHEFRQGKIATFFADVLYRDFILDMLVKDMNNGVTFSDELSLEEMQWVVSRMVDRAVQDKIEKQIMTSGIVPTNQDRELMKEVMRTELSKKGNKKFLEIVKDELENIPMDVMVNIKGKQRYMAQNADKITNMIKFVLGNADAIARFPDIGTSINQLLEESGMSAIDFATTLKSVSVPPEAVAQQEQPQLQEPVAA